MTDSEYLPHFEDDETERVERIRKHIEANDLDYLYKEFDFAENETITDAKFDKEGQLHVYFIIEEDYNKNEEKPTYEPEYMQSNRLTVKYIDTYQTVQYCLTDEERLESARRYFKHVQKPNPIKNIKDFWNWFELEITEAEMLMFSFFITKVKEENKIWKTK